MTRHNKRSLPLILNACVAVTFLVSHLNASHFRGGTINWKSEGGLKVHFYYKLGWTYMNGPGCNQGMIGKLVSGLTLNNNWQCLAGCPNNTFLHDVNYFCTAADQVQNWEQGQNDFTYVFPSKGPFTVGFVGGNWIALANNTGGGPWRLQTVVDLRERSDTGEINASPESMSKPVYNLQFGCQTEIRLPIVDADNDVFKCRWSNGLECASVCNALPAALLDENTCTIAFNVTGPDYIPNGMYGVAVTIEDFSRVPMTIGSQKMTPSDSISSTPIQFLVKTFRSKTSCDSIPRFVSPTPKERELLTFEEGDTVNIRLCADNGFNDTSAKANRITASGIVNMVLSPIVLDPKRKETYCTNLTWPTTPRDIGSRIVCSQVQNSVGKDGKQRCFSIAVMPKGCNPSPCQNNGRCVSNSATRGYTCICRPGFTGVNCETKIDACVILGNCKTTTKPPKSLCPLDYEQCQCYMREARQNHWMGLSGFQRNVMLFFFGFPLGLALSIFTFYLCHLWVVGQRRDKKKEKRRPPKPLNTSPGDSTWSYNGRNLGLTQN